MRFACQSCGKAYNLPEERIADKSNVKLKCRVCGAIVEVKRQGELVAIVLDESEFKRGRVSEAPAPLTTLSPEDDADDGATISIPEAALNDRGALQLGSPAGLAPLQLGLQTGAAPLPPAPPTGFSPSSLPPPPPLSRPELGSSRLESANLAPPLPPLSPPPPPLEMELPSPAMSAVSGMSAASAMSPAMLNGNNGASDHFFASSNGEASDVMEERIPRVAAPVAASPLAMANPNAMASNGMASNGIASNGMATGGMATLPEELPQPVERDDTMKKMLAAFLTGVLIDRLIAGLFF